MMRGFLLVTCLIFLTHVFGEVNVRIMTQYIYEKSPKLRIRGSGFDANAHDILLDLGGAGQPSLVFDKDFTLTKDSDGDGLILRLLSNGRWVDFGMTNGAPPVALILNGVRFSSDPKRNLLPQPVIVAHVLKTPTVQESTAILFQPASNELRINGSGFIGSREVDFYFKPPLTKEVAYEDITPYPLHNDQIVLRLRHGYHWRENAGPLYVIGIDTGGGPVKLNGDEGVQVANVLLTINVDSTASSQLIYADESNLIINGDGFNAVGNILRFSNGLLGQNIDYITTATSKNSISLRLVPGSFWREDFENLPGPLTLLAVDAGQGFVPVGPLGSGDGCDIATVFERPVVYPSNEMLFRTHSHALYITGSGFLFPPSPYKPRLQFEPRLTEQVDYNIHLVGRNSMVVILLDGRAWRADPGPLKITHINTRGDDNGWITLPGNGIHVAEIVADQKWRRWCWWC